MDNDVMDVRMKNWLTILETQASSGLSKKDFCQNNGIKESVFFRWQRKIRKKLLEEQTLKRQPASIHNPDNKEEGSFFELTPASPTPAAAPQDIDSLEFCYPPELKIPSSVNISYDGFSVSISGSISPDALTAVLKAVKNA